MKTTGRLVVLVLALALALASCTGDDGGKDGGDATGPSGGTGGTGPTGTISVPPGSSVYRYANAGLVVILDLDDATLEVQNQTGRELAKPDFYVLDARDGTEVDGKVEAPTAVPAGETATFDVALGGIDTDNIGLVVLLMGKDNYGAFVQQ